MNASNTGAAFLRPSALTCYTLPNQVVVMESALHALTSIYQLSLPVALSILDVLAMGSYEKKS